MSLHRAEDGDQSLATLLGHYVRDLQTSWSCGGFGAIAEFSRDPGEPATISDSGPLSVATARAALRLLPSPELRPIAYEAPSRDPRRWNHGLALCLPDEDCAMSGRTLLTELGPDRDAIRAEDRDAVLFDLGLGVPQADICVRISDPEWVARFRAETGQPFQRAGNPLMAAMPQLSPHRVFICRFGRIEVFQPIPPADGKSPEGPHTHVLPRLLAQARSHAANLPILRGWTPCMTMFPPNPHGPDGRFERASHLAFQPLWRRFGAPEFVALKDAVMATGKVPERVRTSQMDEENDRLSSLVARVAVRQWRALSENLLPV